MGIKNKLIGIIAILIIVPLTVMGVASYMKADQLLTDNFLESNLSLTREIAHSIEQEFQGYLSGVEMVANSANAKNILRDPQGAFQLMDLFKQYEQNYGNAFQMYIGTNDGEMRIYPHFEFDADYDPRQRAWYKLAESTGQAGWTKMYLGAVRGTWSISGAAPVKDATGKFVGAVATSLDLTNVSNMIAELKVGRQGYVFVLDNDAKVVAHPDPNQIGELMPIKEIQDLIAAGKTSGKVDYSYTNGDNKVTDKYAVYEYIDSLGWYVMTSMYYEEIEEHTRQMLINGLIIGIITLLIAGIIGLGFASSITKPILVIVKDMEKVEQGDMTVVSKVTSKDEIGTLAQKFNNMISNVRTLLENASNVSHDVADAAQTLAASAQEASASSDEVNRTIDEIAKGATDQAHDTESAAILAGNLDEKFGSLHDNSREISDNADNVKEINQTGANVLLDLKTKSEENNQSTVRIAGAIKDLEDKSQAIGGILVTISSIAEQTNLLALNASIEAARAGEAGRGFAVVADEIRKLAEESSKSADEIRNIVMMIQDQTGNTVRIMDEFKSNADLQYEAVEEMDKSFEAISESIESVSVQITGIDTFITEMLKDKDAIIASIGNISSVSEETAAASEEVSATMDQQNAAVESVAMSADQLSDLARELSEQINKFKI